MAKHYPSGFKIGKHCHLALWLTKFRGELDENDASPDTSHWRIEKIYTSPLVTGNPKTGLLDAIYDRINSAVTARSQEYVKTAKAAAIRTTIDAFRGAATVAEKDATLVSLLCTARANYATATAALHNDFVAITRSFYLPSNHHDDSAGAGGGLAKITTLLRTSPTLFEQVIPDPKTGSEMVLGDAYIEDLFRIPLITLYNKYRPAYDALRIAKETGVLKYDNTRNPISGVPTPLTDAEDIEIRQGGNAKCCYLGACKSVPNLPGLYCEQTADGQCNAMSDPCPTV